MKSPLSVCLFVGQSVRLSLCPSVSLSLSSAFFLGMYHQFFWEWLHKLPKIKSLHIFTISPQKHVFFCLQIKGKAFYKLKVYFWVCVCVHVCVCVFTSIHREGFTCLDQLEYQETDQRCYVGDVNFLCQVPSQLLQNAAPNLYNKPLDYAHTPGRDKATA